MTTWFTSDLHYKHKRITEITNRHKDTTAEDHDNWVTDLWNSQVQPNDTIYHVGDFNFSSRYEDWFAVLNKLNGNKFFIKGNHDSSKVISKVLSNGLVHSFKEYTEIKIGDTLTAVMHYPITSWRNQGYGSFMLHGHCHGNLEDRGGKILDVGLDSAYNIFGKYKFFTEQDVLEYMLSREVISNDHHKVY